MKNTKFDFENKTAVITGASRGIGLAIASAFLESGASVVNISKSKSEVNMNDSRYSFICEDVNNLKGIEKIINDFSEKEQKIDFWINNAGIYPQSLLMDISEKTWDETFSTNLKSIFFASQYIAEHMKKNGGVILNASSFAAKMPSINSGIYAATKSAVISLTKSMAAEWARYGIRVNSYCPGLIFTDMTKKLINKKEKELISPIALSRCGFPNEVANVVLFLCSDASSYITGENIEISGGKFLVQNQGDLYKK